MWANFNWSSYRNLKSITLTSFLFFGGVIKIILLQKQKHINFWLWFQLLAVNPLFFGALVFKTTETAVSSRGLEIGLFRAGLVISPPVSRRDCRCGVMLRAQLGVNDIAWAGRQASPAVLLSVALQAPRIQNCAKGVGDGRWGGGQTISAAVRRSNDSLP